MKCKSFLNLHRKQNNWYVQDQKASKDIIKTVHYGTGWHEREEIVE